MFKAWEITTLENIAGAIFGRHLGSGGSGVAAPFHLHWFTLQCTKTKDKTFLYWKLVWSVSKLFILWYLSRFSELNFEKQLNLDLNLNLVWTRADKKPFEILGFGFICLLLLWLLLLFYNKTLKHYLQCILLQYSYIFTKTYLHNATLNWIMYIVVNWTLVYARCRQCIIYLMYVYIGTIMISLLTTYNRNELIIINKGFPFCI